MASEQWIVVGISGITCGGKTTLASKLFNYFQEHRGHELKTGIEINRVEILNQDNYFRPVDDPKHKHVKRLNHINWEIIESIDTDRMVNDIMEKLGKKFVLYNTISKIINRDDDDLFKHHYESGFNSMRKYDDDWSPNEDEDLDNLYYKHIKHNFILNILIIEGFLIFNHAVTLDLCNIKFHIHVPYELCYERRKKRSYDPPDVLGKNFFKLLKCLSLLSAHTGYFEMIVWPEYEKHLKSIQNHKDVIFLNGEVSPDKCFEYVLKRLIEDL
jgi:uridine kinase